MKQCPNCGSRFVDEAKFCPVCGTAVADPAPASPDGAGVPNGADINSTQPNANPGYTAQPDNSAQPGANNGYNTQNGGNYGYYADQKNPNPGYQPSYAPPAPVYDPYDHTREFDAADISNNKVFAMSIYLLGLFGIIVALIASHDSPYVAFHVRQGLKFEIVEVILAVITTVLCWTVIVPIAAAVALVILFVLRVIMFISICKGQAKEPGIIRSLGFLR